MFSPSPFSLCCTLLLCLPLALFFSTTTTAPPIFHAVTNVPSRNTGNDSPTPALQRITADAPPKNLSFPPSDSAYQNNEDDNALFRLAGRTKPNPNPKSPWKIAFMFLTTTPLPFAPLWHLFFNPNQTGSHPHYTSQNLFNIYIHADPNRTYSPPFGGLFAGRTIPSKPTRRSDPSLIAAARRLLARALLDDTSNAMFALLSPSCIPLHSFSLIYRTLTARPTKSFIEILKNEPSIRQRYEARGEGAMLPEGHVRGLPRRVAVLRADAAARAAGGEGGATLGQVPLEVCGGRFLLPGGALLPDPAQYVRPARVHSCDAHTRGLAWKRRRTPSHLRGSRGGARAYTRPSSGQAQVRKWSGWRVERKHGSSVPVCSKIRAGLLGAVDGDRLRRYFPRLSR